MIVPAALLAVLQADAARKGDVVVTARPLPPWRAVMLVEAPGTTRCRVVRSNGDPAVDATGCTAMADCIDESARQLAAAPAGTQRATRRRLIAAEDTRERCFAAVRRTHAGADTPAPSDQPEP